MLNLPVGTYLLTIECSTADNSEPTTIGEYIGEWNGHEMIAHMPDTTDTLGLEGGILMTKWDGFTDDGDTIPDLYMEKVLTFKLLFNKDHNIRHV